MLEYFTALLPATLVITVVVVIYGMPYVTTAVAKLLSTPERLEIVKELLLNFAFMGTAAGVFFGLKEDDVRMLPFSIIWLVVFYWAADKAAGLIANLRQAQEKSVHRKMAGTVRSIVRNEVAKAIEAQKEKQDQ